MPSEGQEISQVRALQVSMRSVHPLADETDGRFMVHRLPDENPVSSSRLQKLQSRLNSIDEPALVHELRDVYLQSTHWMLSIGGDLVSDTRYLIHDQHLSRNFAMIRPDERVSLDSQRIWVMGVNYSPGNYWHWHAQSLPAILHAVETIPAHDFHRISVLTGPLTAWQREGIAALGLAPNQVEEMPRRMTVHLDRLLYSDLLSSRQVFGKNHARRRTAELLRFAAGSATHPLEGRGTRRLFISRGDTKRRPLLNEGQLSDALERLGFTIIANTGLALLDQVRMYEAADIVVAPHGAGSTNMLFMQAGRPFVEFQQASHVNAGPLSLGKSSALTPYAEIFPDDGRGQATEGWTVDIQRAISLVRSALDCH